MKNILIALFAVLAGCGDASPEIRYLMLHSEAKRLLTRSGYTNISESFLKETLFFNGPSMWISPSGTAVLLNPDYADDAGNIIQITLGDRGKGFGGTNAWMHQSLKDVDRYRLEKRIRTTRSTEPPAKLSFLADMSGCFRPGEFGRIVRRSVTASVRIVHDRDSTSRDFCCALSDCRLWNGRGAR